jgi:hypothetical protein
VYEAAFVLAQLVNSGQLAWWQDWNQPPAPIPFSGPRGKIEGVLWAAFGFDSSAVFRDETPPVVALGSPARVMIDPFFDSQHPDRVTVVKYTAPGTSKAGNSIKVRLDDPAWIWNPPKDPPTPVTAPVEYNPVNTYNQQNGVWCALPAATATNDPGGPAGTYHTLRVNCPRYGADNVCSVNNKECAADGAGGTRISKPRVIVPSAPGVDDWLLTPTAFDELVARARTDKNTGHALPLPRARDLSILIGWAQQGHGNGLDFSPLLGMLGPQLLGLLTEP